MKTKSIVTLSVLAVAAAQDLSCSDLRGIYQGYECCGSDTPDAPLPGCSDVSVDSLKTGAVEADSAVIAGVDITPPAPAMRMIVTSCNDPSVDASVPYRTRDHQVALWDDVKARKPDLVLNLGDNYYGDVLDATLEYELGFGTYDTVKGDFYNENGTVATANTNNYFTNSEHKLGILDSVPSYRDLRDGVFEWDGSTRFGDLSMIENPVIKATWDDHDFSPNNGGKTWQHKCRARDLFESHFNALRSRMDSGENVRLKYPTFESMVTQKFGTAAASVKGEWAATASYSAGDVVFSGSTVFKCTADHAANAIAPANGDGRWAFAMDGDRSDGRGSKWRPNPSVGYFCSQSDACDPYKFGVPQKCDNDDPSTSGGIFHGPYSFDLAPGVMARSYGALGAFDNGLTLDVVLLDDHWDRDVSEDETISEMDLTFFGEKQREFIEEFLSTSTAYIKVIASGSPMFVPDYFGSDNLFLYPKDNMWLRNVVNKYNVEQLFFVAGDTHSVYATKDSRYTNIPLHTFVGSGAHRGGGFAASRKAARHVWGSNKDDTSMYLQLDVHVEGEPHIEFRQIYKSGAAYTANAPVRIPLSDMRIAPPVLTRDYVPIEAMVNDFTPSVNVAGAALQGYQGCELCDPRKFDLEHDSIYLSIADHDGNTVLDATRLARRGYQLAYTGADVAGKLRLGSDISLTMEWRDVNGSVVETDVRDYSVTFANKEIGQLSLLGIQYTYESFLQTTSGLVAVTNPAGLSAQDMTLVSSLKLDNLVDPSTMLSADPTVYAAGQLWRSLYTNSPPEKVEIITASDGSLCYRTTAPTFNSLYFGNNVALDDGAYTVTPGNGFPLLRDDNSLIIVKFRTDLSKGGSFPYTSFYFPDSVDLAAHNVTSGTIPGLFRIKLPYADGSGYIQEHGGDVRQSFNLKWPSNNLIPANSADAGVVIDFDKDTATLFFDGKYAASVPLPAGYRGLAAVMSNPNGQVHLCGFEVFRKPR